MARLFKDEVTLAIAGQAGQGIQSIEAIVGPLVKRSGRHYLSASEFMSRVRGGANSTEIRVSSRPVSAYREGIDLLVALHAEALPRLGKRISPATLVVGEAEKIGYPGMIDAPFSKLAAEAGGALYASTAAAGYLCGLLSLKAEDCLAYIREFFARKGPEAAERNAAAMRLGHAAGAAAGEGGIRIEITPDEGAKGNLLVSGSDAVALGALAGGCDFVCGYPMSPATALLEKMAALSEKFDIAVEQVEDEVGVVNMAIGAWYAGARALVSTSGGGFALMCEGLSLAGAAESPLVIHLCQRPGPATGLPTRTEQGDLNLALYAGHGDFPRILLAPGSMAEGFELGRLAFDLADRYQLPVFILTDQFFADSVQDCPAFAGLDREPERSVVETGPGYRRYVLTEDGRSPRGIPGYGKGMVRADSHEHDESGHLSEDLELRARMVDKRRRKGEAARAAALPPRLYGPEDYRTLLLCWGSTLGTLLEAAERLGRKDLAVLHFPWLYPVPDQAGDYLRRARKRIDVECSSQAQLAQLLHGATGCAIEEKVLKYDGLPFGTEGLAAAIERLL
ncbi:MAG TPA: 2-oxoacid:acceptor oxidoreductase subunit alpha [Spirochaetia bacterium]|nr:2-oxoacid:acceptor oxidoreductase subunit alpha [Spirochaetia bacterium]HRZ64931.1 2-oxoacid:acceptor oxidoreductase subunit alpha [Spirochaetia bacterium]